MIPLVIILGPTASGKSELGISVAAAVAGEIVNCDSMQIYRRFDIGTAKVPAAERRAIPHHLIDLIEPTQLFNAGEYSQAARVVLHEIAARRHVPVVVGGTGFYLRALLYGLSAGPPRSEAIRNRLEARERKRPGSLHRILSRLDPVAAARIHRNDKNKTLRAIEVRLLEGKSLSTLFERGRDPLTGFRPIKLGLNPPRDLLHERLDARTVRIFERGLIEEVRSMLSDGVPPDAKPFESLGYKQALQVIQNRLSPQQALEATQLETRQYAKRQLTWFRKEEGVHWLEGFGDDPDIQRQALTIVTEELKMTN